MRIGPITIDPPAMLAPLAGYTDLTYRLICRSLGAPYCATEVTLDTSINLSPKLRRKLIQMHDRDHPLAGQIMGREPAGMAEAARHLVDMGCDVVDLNFACPVRKALRRRRGGHMMRDARTGIAILKAVADVVEIPWTLKVRKSYDEGDTNCEEFWRLAEAAFNLGAAAICVHGRSVEARYAGPADWEFLAKAKQHFADRTIIGSGDLLTAQAGLDMLRQTGVEGVSFARGALGNPWIFRQFEQALQGREPAHPTIAEQRAVLSEHFRMCHDLFGATRGPRLMYRFGIRYARMHPTPKPVRQAFINARTGPNFLEILDMYYSSQDKLEDATSNTDED